MLSFDYEQMTPYVIWLDAQVNNYYSVYYSRLELLLYFALDISLTVYTKEFGVNHKLTVDARKRIDRLQADLSKPREG